MLQQRVRNLTDKPVGTLGYFKITRDRTVYAPPVLERSYIPKSSSMVDYVHQPGSPSEVIIPLRSRNYYENNPIYRGVTHTTSRISEPLAFDAHWSKHLGGSSYGSLELSGHNASLYLDGVNYPATYLSLSKQQFNVQSWPDPNEIEAARVALFSQAKLLSLPRVNILTSIGELKDFKGLINFFKVRLFSKKTFSEKFLGYNFGVAPFVSDLRKIRKLWNNKDKSFVRWNEFSSKKKLLRFSEKFASSDTYGTYATTYSTNSIIGRIRYDYVFTYRFVKARYYNVYLLPNPITKDDGSDLTAQLWGLNKPLTALWNLIPFSFMVDWIYNIGDSVESFESAKPTLKHDVVYAGWSHSAKLIVTCETYVTFNGLKQPIGRTTEVLRHFRRVVVPPSTMGPLPVLDAEFKPSLSGFQLALTSAIIHTRMK